MNGHNKKPSIECVYNLHLLLYNLFQARATDSTVYYSCDDHFSQIDDDNDTDQVHASRESFYSPNNEMESSLNQAASNSEGNSCTLFAFIIQVLTSKFTSLTHYLPYKN